MQNKKIIPIGFLLIISILFTACNSNNESNSETTTTITTTNKETNMDKDKVNSNAKDIFEYYNVNYEKPESLNDIVGYYEQKQDKENYYTQSKLIVLPDGRYLYFSPILAEDTSKESATHYSKYYFDESNVIHEKKFNDLIPPDTQATRYGRIIEKDGVYYLCKPDADDYYDKLLTNLDSEGNQVINQIFQPNSKKNIEKKIKDIENNNNGFIKGDKYYTSKNIISDEAFTKKEFNIDSFINSTKIKAYENTAFKDKSNLYIKELLDSNSVNDLLYLVSDGITDDYSIDSEKQEIQMLTPDELKSVKNTDKDLKYGYRIYNKINNVLSEFPREAYATDGESVYSLKYNQLDIDATNMSSEQPSFFLKN